MGEVYEAERRAWAPYRPEGVESGLGDAIDRARFLREGQLPPR
jgi:hypothetical protein